jgi:CBS domain-containing protein
LTRKNFQDFDRSALAFLSRAGQLAPLRSVSETTTLPEAIALMAEERLHRLYITARDTGAVRGVVTLSDVIQLLTGHRHHSHHSHHATESQ